MANPQNQNLGDEMNKFVMADQEALSFQGQHDGYNSKDNSINQRTFDMLDQSKESRKKTQVI